MEDKKTESYYKAFGVIAGIFVVGYFSYKWLQGKKNKQAMNHITAMAELDKITSKPAEQPANKAEGSANQVTFEDKLHTNAFTGEKEDVAAPTLIEVGKTHNAAGASALPKNAFVGQDGNPDGFQEGDIVYSAGDNQIQKARMVSKNYVLVDADGNQLGTKAVKNKEKLGVLQVKEDGGAYIKCSPDFRTYAFVPYNKIYKLV